MTPHINQIKALAGGFFAQAVEYRRHFHAYPELSMHEHETARYIARLLGEWGIAYKEGVAGTGIVAHIEGEAGPGPVIALRADMDALPIHEENRVPYRSCYPGVMHACGHDVHMASLLGAARILQATRGEWGGSFRLLFQPSEEKYPGGASLMIREGVLNDPVPSAIFGQHVFPGLHAGKVGVRAGNYMASTDEVYITVRGKGGHAATPHLLVDPVLIAAHIITGLQGIVSRNANPMVPTVLSFGRITAEGQTNVIPDEVKLEGTMRCFDEMWRKQMQVRIRETAVFIAQGMGGDCEVFIDSGYPSLVNDQHLVGQFLIRATDYLGADNVVELDKAMTAEDFARYARKIPGCFYRLGTGKADAETPVRLHTSSFDVDESSLETGMGLMAWVGLGALESQKT